MGLGMEVRTDLPDLARWLDRAATQQLPFAAAVAITRTVRDARDEMRAKLPSRFTIRNQGVIRGLQSTAASKRDWPRVQAEVGHRDEYMALQETGGTKRPRDGQHLAIPTRAIRRTKTGRISAAKKPKHLIRSGKATADEEAIRAKRGRRSKRRLGLLYLLRPRGSIEPALELEATVRSVVARVHGPHFVAALDQTLEPPKRSLRHG